jgi:hypothetical protein
MSNPVLINHLNLIFTMEIPEQRFYRRAFWLSMFTISYNIIEGIVSMALGYADAIGAAGLIYFSLSEGKEAFEKARH